MTISPDQKLCRKCDTVKPLVEFYNDKNRHDGKHPHCSICHRLYMRNRYANSPGVRDKHLVKCRERQKDPEYRRATAERSGKFYQSIRGRTLTLIKAAKRRDPNATITYEWVFEQLKHGKCAVTGIPFDLTRDYRKKSGRRYNPLAPSIDRIEPSKGYTNENTRMVLWQFNAMKNEISDGELYLICKAFVERFEGK